MKHERLMVVSVAGFMVNLVGIFVFHHGGSGKTSRQEAVLVVFSNSRFSSCLDETFIFSSSLCIRFQSFLHLSCFLSPTLSFSVHSSISVCVSICLLACLCIIYLSFCVCLCVSICVCMCVYMCVCFSLLLACLSVFP